MAFAPVLCLRLRLTEEWSEIESGLGKREIGRCTSNAPVQYPHHTRTIPYHNKPCHTIPRTIPKQSSNAPRPHRPSPSTDCGSLTLRPHMKPFPSLPQISGQSDAQLSSILPELIPTTSPRGTGNRMSKPQGVKGEQICPKKRCFIRHCWSNLCYPASCFAPLLHQLRDAGDGVSLLPG